MSATLCWSARRALLCSYVTRRLLICTSSTTPTGSGWGTRSLATAPLTEAKPFNEIPGPRRLPLIGSALSLLIALNRNRKVPIRELQKSWMQKYGMIYRAKVPTFPEVVIVHEPQDIEAVFRAEGKYPSRAPFQVWKQARNELKMEMGVLLSEGEEWHRQRVPMSKFAMVPRKVAEFHEDFNTITLDLLKNIQQRRNLETNVVSDTADLLFKWSFESVCRFVLGKRMGCLNEQVPQDCQELIEVVQKLFDSTQRLMTGPPLHMVWSTKEWKFQKQTLKRLYELSLNHVKEKLKEIREEDHERAVEGSEAPDKVDILTYLVHSGKQSLEEAATNAVDLMTAGIDTTSYTLVWCLYNLGRNPEVQEKLRSEVQSVVGSDKMVTPAHIEQMPFLRDCFKESLRLCPIVVGNGRFIQEDVVLSGYRVPAGATSYSAFLTTYLKDQSLVLSVNLVSGRLPHIFPEPERFMPERWSRENKNTPPVFGSLPFGFGPRMCVGRRVAELELHIAMAHIMRNFKVEYPETTPVSIVQKFILTPDRPINLAFVDLQ